jgi:hypothetical protein
LICSFRAAGAVLDRDARRACGEQGNSLLGAREPCIGVNRGICSEARYRPTSAASRTAKEASRSVARRGGGTGKAEARHAVAAVVGRGIGGTDRTAESDCVR